MAKKSTAGNTVLFPATQYATTANTNPYSQGTYIGGWTTGSSSWPPTTTWPPTVGAPLAPMPAALPNVQLVDSELEKQIEEAKNSPHAALIGYRAWYVDLEQLDGPYLRSIQGALWPYKKELEAHKLEAKCHGNGIHAARTEAHLLRMGYSGPIVGEVYLWGRIIHGVTGFRAQYAYPKHLYAAKRTWVTDLLAKKYGVPVDVRTPKSHDDLVTTFANAVTQIYNTSFTGTTFTATIT